MEPQELAQRVRILRGVDIFSELRRPHLEELAQKVELINLKPNENLIRKGEQGHAMYMITDGFVKVHDGTYEFAKLGKGECFGEYALIDPEVRNASVSGATDAKLFKLNQDDFYELAAGHPGFVNSVLIIMVRRLRRIDEVQKSLADSYLKITGQKEKIERQNLELMNLNEEKSHLMNLVANDIRNPLSSSISIAETLQDELDEKHPEYAEHTQALTRSMWRINEMATKVLEVMSAEVKRTEQEMVTVGLGKIAREVQHSFFQWSRKKEIAVELDHEEANAELNPEYASQIIENLLSNAIKFSPFGRRVLMKAYQKEGKAIFEIKDQGPGFTDADKEKLYEKFARLSAIPTDGENSIGLGLSIAKKYVERMKGEIELVSEKGKGATFIVKFDATELPS